MLPRNIVGERDRASRAAEIDNPEVIALPSFVGNRSAGMDTSPVVDGYAVQHVRRVLPNDELSRGGGMRQKSANTDGGLIRACRNDEFSRIHFIINDAAVAYRGAIPDDRWHEPYMSEQELAAEIKAGVCFLGWYSPPDTLLGVMGAQDAQDVTLIRHAYVLSTSQRGGIGSDLISALMEATERPLLVGTWKAATWAIAFYERHGFRPVDDTATLLRRYWTIPDRQIETSVVLADRRWFAAAEKDGAACAG